MTIHEINFPKGLLEQFLKNTVASMDDDQFCIDCKKGLWGVCGQDRNYVYKEAINYFQQYYSDGEYESAQG